MSNPISFRLSQKAADNLAQIVNETGLNQTAAVEMALALVAKELVKETEMNTTKNNYYVWAGNDAGASMEVGRNYTSIREAENDARRQLASGWTVHIVKVWIDGDGRSYNSEYDQEIKSFRIR